MVASTGSRIRLKTRYLLGTWQIHIKTSKLPTSFLFKFHTPFQSYIRTLVLSWMLFLNLPCGHGVEEQAGISHMTHCSYCLIWSAHPRLRSWGWGVMAISGSYSVSRLVLCPSMTCHTAYCFLTHYLNSQTQSLVWFGKRVHVCTRASIRRPVDKEWPLLHQN